MRDMTEVLTKWRVAAVGVLLSLATLSSGCAPAERSADGEMSVAEAARYAGFALPDGAQPLGAARRSGMDEMVTFAARVPAASVDDMLQSGQFDQPLEPGRQVFQEGLAGVPIPSGAPISSAQETEQVGERMLTRDVLVVHDDPARPLVYVWAFTT